MIETKDLVLQALEKGFMIHGSGKPEKDRRYPNPVYSVMITATTKTKIVVYAAATHEDHETALRTAIENALERANSKVQKIK